MSTTSPPTTSDGCSLRGRYDVVEWDIQYLRSLYPRWEHLSHETQQRLRFAHPEAALDYQSVPNLVVDGYLEHLADRFDPAQSPGSVAATHIAVGTSTTSPAGGDTALGNEVFRSGYDGSTDNGTNVTVTMTIGSGEANGNDLAEVGAFNSSSGGTMINHALFSEPITKNSSKEITVTITLFFSDR